MKFNEQDVLNNILNKVKEINEIAERNIEFLGFEGGVWVNTKTRLILKCNIHNIIGSTRYYELMKNGWKCNECKKKDQKGKGMITPKEARNRIEKIFKNNNPHNYSFSKIESTFKGYKEDITITCPIHGDFKVKYYTVINCKGITCPKCKNIKKRMTEDSAILNIENKIQTELSNKVTFLGFVNNKWIGSSTRLILKCNIHNIIWDTTVYHSFISSTNTRCKECAKDSRFILESYPENELIIKIIDRVNYLNSKYNINLEFLGFKDNKYIGKRLTKLVLKCNIHNVIWDTTIADDFLRRDGVICPVCSKLSGRISNLEWKCLNEIKKYIKDEDIQQQVEIKIAEPNIFNKTGKVLVDIFIKSLRLFIEIDGYQHTEYIDFFHHNKYSEFINQVNRDSHLKTFCKNNQYELLKIHYVDNNRIEEIIKSFFEEGKDITTKIEPKLLPVLYYG